MSSSEATPVRSRAEVGAGGTTHPHSRGHAVLQRRNRDAGKVQPFLSRSNPGQERLVDLQSSYSFGATRADSSLKPDRTHG